jgi:class 3 adenylate cyclase
MSPAAAVASDRMWMETDVREILPLVQAPTLVIHDTHDSVESVESGRFIAQQIPGAKLLETSGADHAWWSGFQDSLDDVDRFLASLREEEAGFDRVLATVLFTDIVGSTEHAAESGDSAWRALLERHHAVVRAMLGRYRGKEIDTAGDGFLATFHGPARAIKCARVICNTVQQDGIEVRTGIHTGEMELVGDHVTGINVHIGARVAGHAGPGETLVSSTVKDLVAGSGITFEEQGEHELKGVPGNWRLYRVVDS